MSNDGDEKQCTDKAEDVLTSLVVPTPNDGSADSVDVVAPAKAGKTEGAPKEADLLPSKPRTTTSRDLIDRVFGDDGGSAKDRVIEKVILDTVEQVATTATSIVPQTESLPGAYAEGPRIPASASAPSDQRDAQPHPDARVVAVERPDEDTETGNDANDRQFSENRGLAVAQPVGECIDLQEADPVDQEDKREARWNHFLKLGLSLLVFASFIFWVLWMVGIFEEQKQEDDNPGGLHPDIPDKTLAPSSSSTGDPTFIPLPQYTFEAIEQDPTSPQGRAYQWLQNDAMLPIADERQLVQRFALATLYFALDGDNWYVHENWLNDDMHECDWKTKFAEDLVNSTNGACDEDGNYVSLFMTANGLAGTIPLEMTLLTSLQYLDIAGNEIGGTIPSELGLMKSLIELTVDNNKLIGNVPTELLGLTRLQILQLQDNGIDGTFPSEIGLMTDLVEFRWFSSMTGGTMPTEMGLMTSLKSFHVFLNPITGTIPTQIGLLTDMVDFQWSITSTSGSIPTEIGLLTQLQRLQLERQALTGPIPTEFGLMTSLSINVEMVQNLLTGTLPTVLGLLTNMQEFYAFDNHLTGHIPSEFGLLPLLRRIDFEINHLTSTIPTELGETKLESFWISNNDITGTIPTEFGILSDMLFFMINNNAITGTIPEELCHHFDLMILFNAGKNELTGTVPSQCFVNKTKLEEFQVNDNDISGNVPSEIGLLPSVVKVLNFANTSMTGRLAFPANVSDLEGLQLLNLKGTELSGEVPHELCSIPGLAFDCLGDVLCGCNCTCDATDGLI